MNIKKSLIHWLGGVTLEESRQSDIYCLETGEYHAYISMRQFAISLNGLHSDEWSKKVYEHIKNKIAELEKADAKEAKQ